MSTKEYYRTHKEQILTRVKNYNNAHKNKISIYKQKYRNTHRDKYIKANRKYRITNKDRLRNFNKKYHLKSQHNLSIKEYNDLVLSQNNKCAICGQPLDFQNTFNICIDHSHLTGVIRGILCRTCNMAIGLLRDNPEYVRNALEYLERNKSGIGD